MSGTRAAVLPLHIKIISVTPAPAAFLFHQSGVERLKSISRNSTITGVVRNDKNHFNGLGCVYVIRTSVQILRIVFKLLVLLSCYVNNFLLYSHIYTVGHKKGATFIFTIPLAIVDRFQ